MTESVSKSDFTLGNTLLSLFRVIVWNSWPASLLLIIWFGLATCIAPIARCNRQLFKPKSKPNSDPQFAPCWAPDAEKLWKRQHFAVRKTRSKFVWIKTKSKTGIFLNVKMFNTEGKCSHFQVTLDSTDKQKNSFKLMFCWSSTPSC